MKHLNKIPIHPILLVALLAVLVLAGLGSCQRKLRQDMGTAMPRFTMKTLDAKAKPFIDEAYAAVPKVVADLCSDRTKLFWLLMKDKAAGTTLARDCIASVLIINIRQTPSWKTAVVYKRASNTDAAIGMTEDASLEILSRQFAKAINLFK